MVSARCMVAAKRVLFGRANFSTDGQVPRARRDIAPLKRKCAGPWSPGWRWPRKRRMASARTYTQRRHGEAWSCPSGGVAALWQDFACSRTARAGLLARTSEDGRSQMPQAEPVTLGVSVAAELRPRVDTSRGHCGPIIRTTEDRPAIWCQGFVVHQSPGT